MTTTSICPPRFCPARMAFLYSMTLAPVPSISPFTCSPDSSSVVPLTASLMSMLPVVDSCVPIFLPARADRSNLPSWVLFSAVFIDSGMMAYCVLVAYSIENRPEA